MRNINIVNSTNLRSLTDKNIIKIFILEDSEYVFLASNQTSGPLARRKFKGCAALMCCE